MPTWAIVLTSAGVAALVSGAMTLVGQAIERRWRRRELALTKALEIATTRAELARVLASETKGKLELHDHVVVAERYYKWITHLLDTGELPPDAPSIASGNDPRGPV